MWVKHSRVWRKTTYKQTKNIYTSVPNAPVVTALYIPFSKSPAVVHVFLLDSLKQSISIKTNHDYKRNTVWYISSTIIRTKVHLGFNREVAWKNYDIYWLGKARSTVFSKCLQPFIYYLFLNIVIIKRFNFCVNVVYQSISRHITYNLSYQKYSDSPALNVLLWVHRLYQ